MFQGFFVQCIGFWIILIMVFLDCLGDDGDSVLYKFPVRVSSKLKYRLQNKEERRRNQTLWCQRTCHRDTREQQTRTCVVWFGCCTRSLSLPRDGSFSSRRLSWGVTRTRLQILTTQRHGDTHLPG